MVLVQGKADLVIYASDRRSIPILSALAVGLAVADNLWPAIGGVSWKGLVFSVPLALSGALLASWDPQAIRRRLRGMDAARLLPAAFVIAYALELPHVGSFALMWGIAAGRAFQSAHPPDGGRDSTQL